MGKGMSDEDENKDTFLVMIGGPLQDAAVLRPNELVTGQPDVVDLLDQFETYREEPVVRDFCAALDGWYNYCDNCYQNHGHDRGHDVEEISYKCVDEQSVIDTFLRQLADYAVDGRSAYSTSDVPLVIADTGMEVLPRVDGPGRINPSREDGEGGSSCIRNCDEGLIGEMGPYSGDGYIQLPTNSLTKQEFADIVPMVELPDHDESGTDTIGGLRISCCIAPWQDLKDACREPITPLSTYSDGRMGGLDAVRYQHSMPITHYGGHNDDGAHRLRQRGTTHLQCDVVEGRQLHSVAGVSLKDHISSARFIDVSRHEACCPREGWQSTSCPEESECMQRLPQRQQRRPVIILQDMIGQPANTVTIEIITSIYEGNDRWSDIAPYSIKGYDIGLLGEGRTRPTTADKYSNVLCQSCWRTDYTNLVVLDALAENAEWSWKAMDNGYDRYLQIGAVGVGKRPEDLELSSSSSGSRCSSGRCNSRGAQDSLQEGILTDTYSRFPVYCVGRGISGVGTACCFCLGEVRCLGNTMKLIIRLKHDGFFTVASECCCFITGFDCFIDFNPDIGHHTMWCISELEGRTVLKQPGSPMAQHQQYYIQNSAHQCMQRRTGNPDAVEDHLYGAALGVLQV